MRSALHMDTFAFVALIGTAIVAAFIIRIYIDDVTRSYPHSSDPNFGKRFFWGRVKYIVAMSCIRIMQSIRPLILLILTVLLLKCLSI